MSLDPSLSILKLQQGSNFPPFPELRKTAQKALATVIQETWIGGVSTRRRWPSSARVSPTVLAYSASPAQHRKKRHSTNPLDRLNKGGQTVGRCRRIFPTRPASPS